MLITKIHHAPGKYNSHGMTLTSFVGRLLLTVFIAAPAAALSRLSDILVLLFGAVLMAIGLSSATRLVTQHTGLGRSFALAGVIVFGTCIFGAALWVFGSTVKDQADEAIRTTPAGFKLFMEKVSGNPYGQQLLDQMRDANVAGATGWATSLVTTAAGLITRAVEYAVGALFVAIYLAVQPERCRQLCLRLVPAAHRSIAGHLFGETGIVLQRWLAGQPVVMATIGIMTGIGLWLMGIEAAFALGIMGGLLCFIPFGIQQ